MQIHFSVQAWLESFRLKTLPLALSSIVTGSALAYWQHQFSAVIALLSLLTATLLQILSNLANDYGDMQKGADGSLRIGPNRGMQKGLITREQMKLAIQILIFLAISSGLALLITACDNWHDFFGFIVLGLFAIIAAITYTMGKKPYGYMGLGDISVLLFFGLLGVLGVYYLQTKALHWPLLLPATGCGLLSVGVLNINNLRDIDQDKQNGKNTLVVRLGPTVGRIYHILLLSVAFLCLSAYSFLYVKTLISLVFLALLPLAFRHGYFVMNHHQATDIPPQLIKMVAIAVGANVLFALGLILSA